ncbi:MAG: nickel pincer cofactor biosynthesis protein LarB [Candidatus Binataceae bacterium]
MTAESIRLILDDVAAGRMSSAAALKRLRHLPFEDLGFAKLDLHRTLRRGIPEVVFGDGKSAEQIVAISARIVASGANLIITRLAPEKARLLKRRLSKLDYDPMARVASLVSCPPAIRGHGAIAIVSAGTSDLPVAEEAALCAELFGNRVVRIYDIGVAGLHRLTANLDSLASAAVLIVAAGMEGALPSVVAGLLDKPVVAVPTSAGYGASFSGLAALLGMLNSCASGVTVVNIDNGFGAAVSATLINRVGSHDGVD